MRKGPFLCVNIDHIATVRQARRESVPDPVAAARLAEQAGAIGITAHLREDRRHIQDADVRRLKAAVKGKFNLEMAATAEMLGIARGLRPDEATLVPEKRQELTTEGGLDAAGQARKLGRVVAGLRAKGITVSLFINATARQIRAAARLGAQVVEFHTGAYAHAYGAGGAPRARPQVAGLRAACELAHGLGLRVNLGHGLSYANVRAVSRLPHVEDLNIGHNIVARACLVGMRQAVQEMLKAM